MEEDDVPVFETWKAMEELVDSGKCKNIGVSNFPVGMCRDILSYARHPLACNQVEMHPFNQQEVLVRFMKEKGIALTAFSAFGAISYGYDKSKSCLHDPTINEIATAHGKSPA